MIELLFVMLSLIVLMIASERAVEYTSKLSKILGLSGLSAGFVILSVATSLPELFVSINSSIINQIGLSLGNVLGSNIADVTIILGLAFFISRSRDIKFNTHSLNGLVQFLFISSLIPLFILQTGKLTLMMGVILTLMFIFFTLKTEKKIYGAEELASIHKGDKIILGLKFAVSMLVTILSSKVLVDNSVILAQDLGVPASVIGATIIAFGTSVPELSTTIQAFKKRLFDVGLGNIIGSCITNLTLVLGVSSLLNPSTVNIVSFSSLILFTIISMIVTWYFVSDKKIDKKEAIILMGVYVLFILEELGLSVLKLF
ncbi:Sodium/calcium exchanger MaX1 [Candidatus Tiddalikarchaeum anstoanum]|nr:Sodium/calcium exchanger MaX1 [Candidatus Tiddalikarchaeum anstoanum]